MDPARLPRFCFNCGTAVIAGRRSCLRCSSWLADSVDPAHEPPPPNVPLDALAPGIRVLDRYLVEAVDSVGRLHLCYRAFDTVLERTVTLRSLNGRERSSARRTELRRQARLQNALDHAHIVRTLDYIEDPRLGEAAIVEQYVGTRSLRTWLSTHRDRQPSGLEHALYRQLMLPLAAALAYAHRHGVVHRNLKPRKIFLDRHDRPLIADFGLSSYALPNASSSYPTLVGTLEYMSPELADDPRLVEPSGDIYALGVIFYEIVSGALPITGKNDLDFLNNLLKHPARPLVDVAPDVPLGLDAVIMRCLQKIPAERFTSADELYLALADVLGHTGDAR